MQTQSYGASCRTSGRHTHPPTPPLMLVHRCPLTGQDCQFCRSTIDGLNCDIGEAEARPAAAIPITLMRVEKYIVGESRKEAAFDLELNSVQREEQPLT